MSTRPHCCSDDVFAASADGASYGQVPAVRQVDLARDVGIDAGAQTDLAPDMSRADVEVEPRPAAPVLIRCRTGKKLVDPAARAVTIR